MLKSGWDLTLTLKISADTEDDLAAFLSEIARRIRAGATSGAENYCAGVYEFDLAERELTIHRPAENEKGA